MNIGKDAESEKINTAKFVLGMCWVRNGGWQGVFVRWSSILAQRKWNETLAKTRTKFRQRLAGESPREMHPRGLCLV